jgi:hypothetical protein
MKIWPQFAVMTSDQDVTTEETANKNGITRACARVRVREREIYLSGKHVCMCTKSVTYSYKGPDGVQKGD